MNFRSAAALTRGAEMLGASAGSDIRLGGYALDHLGFGQFKKLNGLLSRDRREVAKEVV
jgi:hypothetical protein